MLRIENDCGREQHSKADTQRKPTTDHVRSGESLTVERENSEVNTLDAAKPGENHWETVDITTCRPPTSLGHDLSSSFVFFESPFVTIVIAYFAWSRGVLLGGRVTSKRMSEGRGSAHLEDFHTEALCLCPCLFLAPVQVAFSAGHRFVAEDQLDSVGVNAALCQ
jgi:hypothetical protein